MESRVITIVEALDEMPLNLKSQVVGWSFRPEVSCYAAAAQDVLIREGQKIIFTGHLPESKEYKEWKKRDAQMVNFLQILYKSSFEIEEKNKNKRSCCPRWFKSAEIPLTVNNSGAFEKIKEKANEYKIILSEGVKISSLIKKVETLRSKAPEQPAGEYAICYNPWTKKFEGKILIGPAEYEYQNKLRAC